MAEAFGKLLLLICCVVALNPYLGSSSEANETSLSVRPMMLDSRLINIQEFLKARFNTSSTSLKIPKSFEELNAHEMRKIKALQVKLQRLQQTVDTGNSELQQRIGILTKNQESLAVALSNLQKEIQVVFQPV